MVVYGVDVLNKFIEYYGQLKIISDNRNIDLLIDLDVIRVDYL